MLAKDINDLVRALRCSSDPHMKHDCSKCAYRFLEPVDKRYPAPPDVIIDGELYWESCDCDRISKEAAERGITQKVLIQVNIAREESKFGFTKEDVLDCFGELLLLPSIKIDGLMNIAPISQDEKYLRFLFGEMKQLKDRLSLEYKVQLKELSMGMSNDFRIAAEEGSTMIRLGRILFKNI